MDINGTEGPETLTGTSGDDVINGLGGNDVLLGGSGNDTLNGGEGNDTLAGQTGADQLNGGNGEDTASYYDSPGAVLVNLLTGRSGGEAAGDTYSSIEDLVGSAYDDTLTGDNGANQIEGRDGNDRIDGGFGADTLNGGFGNDIIHGGGGDDILFGNDVLPAQGEVDTLYGDAGNDSFYAEPTYGSTAGVDRTVNMYGGTGDDIYYVRLSDQNSIFENAGEGYDTIALILSHGGSSSSPNVFYMAPNVEALRVVLGGDLAATLVGNDLANFIESNAELGGARTSTGERTILAGGGDDVVRGGPSHDVIYGESGNDQLSGYMGSDVLVGGEGNDQLDLSYNAGDAASADSLYGGTGDDTYGIDSAGDIVFENPGEGTDTAFVRIQNDGWYAYDNLENIQAVSDTVTFLVGNALDNQIAGAGGSELLLGGDGRDTIYGNGGNDSIYGESGDDSLNGGAGIDYIVGGTGNDFLSGDGQADALYGQDGNDVIFGGSDFATDIMVGGDGNDVIHGDSGLGDYDRMDGGAGNDVYYVDTPDDLTFEAANGGTDTVVANIQGAGYYLYAYTENLTLIGNTPFGVGNELDNYITAAGANGSPTLLGGAGNDTLIGNNNGCVLFGETGNDSMSGGTGADYLIGGDGNDILDAGAGVDRLIGDAGDDVIFLGLGNDVVTGGAGNDQLVWDKTSGGDVVTDFTHGQDYIVVAQGMFSSYADLRAHMSMNNGSTVISYSADTFLILQGVDMNTLTAADFRNLAGQTPLDLAATEGQKGGSGGDVQIALHDAANDDALAAAFTPCADDRPWLAWHHAGHIAAM